MSEVRRADVDKLVDRLDMAIKLAPSEERPLGKDKGRPMLLRDMLKDVRRMLVFLADGGKLTGS